jgi:O-6-methylguanine DNA methyltransferase
MLWKRVPAPSLAVFAADSIGSDLQLFAQLLNQAKLVRAVAHAIGRNPHLIIVPCHRIIRLNGTLGGFAGGLDNKSK